MAQNVSCQSNLRQFGQVFHMYANDNKGWLPPYNDSTAPTMKEFWVNKLSKYVPTKWQNNDDNWPSGAYGGIWNCPTVAPEAMLFCNYGVNTSGVLFSYGTSKKLAQIRPPGILLSDAMYGQNGVPMLHDGGMPGDAATITYGPWCWDGNAIGPAWQLAKRHDNGANALLSDGHVEWRTWVEWKDNSASEWYIQ